jgi:hypothetical protein
MDRPCERTPAALGTFAALSHPNYRLWFFGQTVSLFGMSFATLIPAWAVKILGGDARTNGLLQSARGVGALVAGL